MVNAIFFVIAAILKTDKFTDFTYSLGFVLVAWIAALSYGTNVLSPFLLAFVTLWALRLGTYLVVRIRRIKKDQRFDNVRESWVKFGTFWFLQAIVTALVSLPVVVGLQLEILTLPHLAYFGAGVWFFGLLIETIADWQKFTYKSLPKSKQKKPWVEIGLWKYSRHPNYFGELLVWWGVYAFVLPMISGLSHLMILGPLTITAILLVGTGIPPLEKQHDKKYGENPDYNNYKSRTSILVPLPPKLV